MSDIDDKEIKLKELAEKLTTERLYNTYKIKLFNRINSGEGGLANEIERLARLEELVLNNHPDDKGVKDEIEKAIDEISTGIPDRNKVKRSYTMTAAAREARIKNAQKSTGPRTAEGKKKSAANGNNANWKHGQCSKSMIKKVLGVCTTKCDKYPCAAVEDEETCAGELCLDREGYLKRVNTLVKAALSGDIKDVTEMNLVLVANQQEILDRMMQAVVEDGTVILEDLVNKDGTVVAQKFKNHPHISPIADYMKHMGINLGAMRMTPQELQKTTDRDKDRESLTDLLGAASKMALPPKTDGGEENADTDSSA